MQKITCLTHYPHIVLDSMGMNSTFTTEYVLHALFNNLRYQPDEFNFFKKAAEKGLKEASHEKNARYEELGVNKVSAK